MFKYATTASDCRDSNASIIYLQSGSIHKLHSESGLWLGFIGRRHSQDKHRHDLTITPSKLRLTNRARRCADLRPSILLESIIARSLSTESYNPWLRQAQVVEIWTTSSLFLAAMKLYYRGILVGLGCCSSSSLSSIESCSHQPHIFFAGRLIKRPPSNTFATALVLMKQRGFAQ